MTLRDAPTATSTAVRGLGLLITQQDGHGSTPVVLGRRQLSSVVASPRYQFVLARTRAGAPDFHALLHNSTGNIILRQELNVGADPNDEPAPSNFITPFRSDGRALACIDHSTAGLYTVWSEANNGVDGLGIRTHVGTGNYVSASVEFSGTQLGFSANQRANGVFTGFVMREREDGNVVVLATLADSTTPRTHPGDMTGYSMVTFVLTPTPSAIVTQQVAVTVDVPFDVHQLAEGLVTPLDGSAPRNALWCAGRCDPETWLPSTLGLATVGAEAVHNMAGEGIWICTAETLENMNAWQRIFNSAAGVSHDVRGHVGPSSGDVTRPRTPRDLGLAFDEPWQRLSLLGTDTDPSQDPVLERPTY